MLALIFVFVLLGCPIQQVVVAFIFICMIFFSGDAWWSKICWFLFLCVWDVVGTPEKQLCPLPFWMLDLGVMWILLGSGLCVLSCTYYIIILHILVGIFRLEFKRWMGLVFFICCMLIIRFALQLAQTVHRLHSLVTDIRLTSRSHRRFWLHTSYLLVLVNFARVNICSQGSIQALFVNFYLQLFVSTCVHHRQ